MNEYGRPPPWSVLNDQKRSKSEETNIAHVKPPKIKSKSEGGSGSISGSTSSLNYSKSCMTTPQKVLSKRTLDLVKLMRSKDESPLPFNSRTIELMSNITSLSTALESPLSQSSSANSSLFSDEHSEDENTKEYDKSSNKSNAIIEKLDGKKSSTNQSSLTSALFKSKYISAPSIMEDYSLACESRDSEEESRIATLKLTLNDFNKSSNHSKCGDSFRFDNLQEQSVLKVFFVGDAEVGKTSILRRYFDNSFNETYTKTSGVDFKPDIFQHSDGSMYKCQLWDTAGGLDEGHNLITRAYFKGAHAFALVFSVAHRESFDRLSYWIESIQKYGQSQVAIVLVGNQCDISPESREVSEEDAKGFAQSVSTQYLDGGGSECVYLETSAVSGANVAKLVDVLLSAASVRVAAAASSKVTSAAAAAQSSKLNAVADEFSSQLPPSLLLLSTPTTPPTTPSLVVSDDEREEKEGGDEDMDDEARRVKAAFDASLVACILEGESQSLGSDSPHYEDDYYWPEDEEEEDDGDVDRESRDGKVEVGRAGGKAVKEEESDLAKRRSGNACAQIDHSFHEPQVEVPTNSPMDFTTDETDFHSNNANTRDDGKEVDVVFDQMKKDNKKNATLNEERKPSGIGPAVIVSNNCKCTLS